MTRITEQGKTVALEQLALRRERYKDEKLPRNEDLPAGSPMYFRCIGCGAAIVVGEGYISKPDMCPECGDMRKLGWLE